METYDLEERILSLLIFTSDYRKEGEAVLESYVSQSGKERIIGAYLTQVAYGVFVKEYTMSAFVRGRLEYAYISKWPVNRICRLALLKEISREQDPKPGIYRYSAGNTERMCERITDVRLFQKTVIQSF